MEFKERNLCVNCTRKNCPMRNEDKGCIFNLIIYENNDKIIFYNFPEKKICKIEKSKGIEEITFKEAIREIDIIPTKSPQWKRYQILKLAKDLGFFGINA